MPGDPFAAAYVRLPSPQILRVAAWSTGVVGAVGLYLFKVDAFAFLFVPAVLLAVLSKRKEYLERGKPPHRLFRWYWELAAAIVGIAAYVTAIVVFVR